MVNAVRAEWLEWIQASVGWAILAARAAPHVGPATAVVSGRSEAPTSAPLRLRATITIDIDAHDAEQAEQESDLIRGQFELVKRTHPSAQLAFQRRKPRIGRRPPTPTLVVSPYADD